MNNTLHIDDYYSRLQEQKKGTGIKNTVQGVQGDKSNKVIAILDDVIPEGSSKQGIFLTNIVNRLNEKACDFVLKFLEKYKGTDIYGEIANWIDIDSQFTQEQIDFVNQGRITLKKLLTATLELDNIGIQGDIAPSNVEHVSFGDDSKSLKVAA